MSYLKMALEALQATTSEGEAGAQRCGFTSPAPNHTPATEPPQARPPAPPVTCAAACPWYELNPWTRDPALGAWCHYRMEHLVVGGAACEEFSRGEVPFRQPHKKSHGNHAPEPAGENIHLCGLYPLRGKPWT